MERSPKLWFSFVEAVFGSEHCFSFFWKQKQKQQQKQLHLTKQRREINKKKEKQINK